MEAGTIEAGWLPREDRERVQSSMAARLAEAKGLKPLPIAVQKALSLLRSSDYEVKDVAQAFTGDPALASGVLRLANSALFGGTLTIDSVEQAVVRLGSTTLEELLVTAATSGLFNDSTGAGAFYRDHCAGTAAAARLIASRLQPAYRDGLFLCGLMHDLGKLVLLQSGQALYKKTLDATDMREPDRIHLEERRQIGYDHALVGAYVLKQWNIPEPLPEVVALHHQPPDAWPQGRVGAMIALLRIADLVEPAIAGQRPDLYQDFLIDADDRPESGVAGVSAAALGELFEDLVEARQQTLDLIKGAGR